MTRTFKTARWGGLLVAVYVAAVAVTMGVSGHRVRPLYEGFTPPPPYRWVNPPSAFKAGNQPPESGDADVALTADGSKQVGAVTGDSQVVLNLPAKAFAPHGSDTSVHIHIAPLDPAKLAPPPNALVADGNAYKIDAVYRPSGQPTGPLAVQGNAFLVVPSRAAALLFSNDGRTWQQLAAQATARTDLVGAPFAAPGYLLAGQRAGGATVTSIKAHSNTGRVVLIVVAGVVIALAVLLGPSLLSRSRGRRGRPPGKRA